jgi:hypothetical protein
MSNRVLNFDFFKHGPVIERDEKRIPNRPLCGIMVLDAEPLFFHAEDLGAQGVDAGVSRSGVGA